MNHVTEALKNIEKGFISLVDYLTQVLGSPIAVMAVLGFIVFVGLFILFVSVFKVKQATRGEDQW